MLDAASLPINVRITSVWHDIRKSQNQLLGPMIDSANAFTSPSYCSNNDPNNPRQTFIHPRGLFFFKAFVEHFYQSLTRDGSLAVMGRPPQILDPVAGAKSSRRLLCVSIATGSRRSKTQKLFRFGHFGIPFL